MKIGVVGSVMHDRIETVDGREFESFGGILYNSLALAAITRAVDTVLPFSYVAAEHLETIQQQFFDGFRQIKADNLRVHAAGTDSNILKYVTPASRREKMSIVTPVYERDLLEPTQHTDALLINFINGQELDLETFRQLRKWVDGPIYLDVHNLGKQRKDGVPVPGHRFSAWADWFACIDIVQANEWEAERLLDMHPRSEEEMREAVRRLISVPGPRIAILTLGEMGCAMAWKDPAAGLRYARIPAMPGVRIVDTTGCGDSFSAGFLMKYMRSGSPLSAAIFGATLSGLNCLETGLEGLLKAKNVEDSMEDSYAELLRKVREGWNGEALDS